MSVTLTQTSPSETLRKEEDYVRVRSESERLCESLEIEDFAVQGMPDVSPPKWHLAHTTWFFETFFLAPLEPHHKPFDPVFSYLFNSYYEAVGARQPRGRRGQISRPSVSRVLEYRANVDQRVAEVLEKKAGRLGGEELRVFDTGLHHEQQHQELLLTDIKYNFFLSPYRPAYLSEEAPPEGERAGAARWIDYGGSLRVVGHDGRGFGFDNEMPEHQAYVEPFSLASHLVTNAEYLGFIEDGGYDHAELWLSDGWETARREGWRAPLYWEAEGKSEWRVFTLAGMKKLNMDEPVCHLSCYEADAYARWAGCRLPTEAEWETAARTAAVGGNFRESGRLHPAPSSGGPLARPAQLYGDVWEWTQSPYAPYPGFKPGPGALGEYNGKFMCNQIVLRGGSCVTPASHIRPTYRNFFYPHQRWQFSGLRLAR
ncbi:MAG TPA: ergothioneine biosynthesis protein EgtB [Verrucomicrobiae bacterium]|jgi:ergothioneine biosynthesis protein EgtB|nr:ergothioneine biosynthesis protein EgtB [Verrucomicrobiae bacterium]